MSAAAPTLNLLAVQNAALLRELAKDGAPSTAAELARVIGRDKSNLHKTLKVLTTEGLIEDPLRLTPEGQVQLAMLDRAEARTDEPGLPGGDPLNLSLFHAQILPDPDNAREDWNSDEARLELLALRMDIVEHGQHQNLLVRALTADEIDVDALSEAAGAAVAEGLPLYRLVAGERRWRAIGEAMDEGDWPVRRTIACRLIETDDLGLRIAALSENLQRRDLNPIEKAKGFEALAEAGLSNADIADRFSKTPEHVQQHRSFLRLSEADQARMTLSRDDSNRLTVRQARDKVAALNRAEAPPPEVPVSPIAQLILAECVHVISRRASYHYGDFEVAPGALTDIYVRELVEAAELRAVELNSYGGLVGRYTLRAGHSLTWAAFPRMRGTEVEETDAGLKEAQARYAEIAGCPVPEMAGEPYLTPWLNGPFDITPEGQAVIDQRAAEEAEREATHAANAAARDAAIARGRAAAARAQELFEARRTTPAVLTVDAFKTIAAETDAPLPWRINGKGGVDAADGAPVFGNNPQSADRSAARLRLMVLAINAAADLETPEDEPAPEPEAEEDIDGPDLEADPSEFDDQDSEAD